MRKKALKNDICDLKTDMSIAVLRFMHIIEKVALKPYNISMVSARIMLVIVHFNKINQSEISNYVSSSNSNTSQRLDFLEKKGLITRTFAGDTKDKRKVMVSPTIKGEKLFWEVYEKVLDIKNKVLINFSDEELKAHARFNTELVKILDKIEFNK